jgi:hypothetical protein
MTETNNYWKTEVSKLVRGYMQTTNGMPGNPVNIAGVNKNGQRVAQEIRPTERID